MTRHLSLAVLVAFTVMLAKPSVAQTVSEKSKPNFVVIFIDDMGYQQGGMLRAVRSGPWKLFMSGELYNLDADLAEKTNVAADNPDVVAALRKLLNDFKTDLAKNSREVGVAKNPRTLVPRPGVDGEEGYRPTLSLPR